MKIGRGQALRNNVDTDIGKGYSNCPTHPMTDNWAMSLKYKIIGYMTVALMLYGVADFAILRFALYPKFVELEQQDAFEDARRVTKALEREIEHLDRLCHDWSAWDETYDFIQTRSPEYIYANLFISTFEDNRLNLIFFLNNRHEVVWGEILDHPRQERIGLRDFPKDVLPGDHVLLDFKSNGDDLGSRSVSGMINTEYGPMLVASRPVLNSDNKGPVRGVFIMGRFLTEALETTLRAQTSVDFQFKDLTRVPEALLSRASSLESQDAAGGLWIEDGQEGGLEVRSVFPGLGQMPGILIQVTKPRTITARGTAALRFTVLSLLVACAVLLGMIAWLIQRSVIGPLHLLTRHMLHVERTGDLSPRIALNREDEIGTLGAQYDAMLALLEKKSHELSEDIRKRQSAEDALRNQQQIFKAIVDTARDAIIMIDDNSRITFWNRAGQGILGYRQMEVMGKDLHMLMTPARFHAEYAKGFEKFRHTGQGPVVGKTVELTAIHREGHEVPVELSLAAAQQGGRWHAVGILRDITERKAAENALRESEERYRRVLETVPNAITITTEKEGIYKEVNKFFSYFTGVAREDALDRTPFDLDIMERDDQRTRFLKVLKEKGQVDNLEMKYRRRDGTFVDTLFSARRLRYEGQDCLVSVVSDISEIKKAEEALAESEKRYRTLFERAGDAIFIIESGGEKDGRIVNANQAAAAMYGYPRDELIGMNMGRLVARETIARAHERYGDKIEDVLRVEWVRDEGVHLRKNGHRFSVETSGGIVELGGRDYIFAFHRDISDRKKAEEERLLLATAIEQSPDLVCITDTQRRIEYVNPAFERLTGFSRESVIGKHGSVFKADFHGRLSIQVIWEHLEKGMTWKGRMTNRRQDGTSFDVEAAIAPVTDAKGKIFKFITVERDITESIKQERQIRQTQKLEAIGTLAGGVAHDFNNILSGILGFTEIALLEIEQESAARAALQKVIAASERAGDLVRQILAFSRKSEQEFKPTLVRIIVKEALKLCRASLPSFIQIRQHIDSDLAVMGDPTQIHQVVMNLCTNAGHAMEETGGVLKVEMDDLYLDEAFAQRYPNASPGTFIRILVSDTGCGIPPENLERIFDPFFTTKKQGKGTGLGLSVVHGIVESHGGLLTVESQPGVGTAITVYLPAIEAQSETAKDHEVVLPTGTERVLFVDDEPFQVELGKEVLGRLGYQVVTETDSLSALDRFCADPDAFDLLMTDMTMPVMTGDELGRAVLEIRPDLPVILCTGYSERITESEAVSMGFKGFAMKPMVVGQIARIVRDVLDGK